jgi:GNAT superfamily N-acetyltransferase
MTTESIAFRRLKLSDFIPLITLYKKLTPATLYYWPGLLQPPSASRNFIRWLFGRILILCALINIHLPKFSMYLQPDEFIPFLFIGAFHQEIVGVAFLVVKKREPLTAELGIGVVDEWQGKGLGSRLMERIIREARILGFSRLALKVYSSNYKAVNLYRKYGFKERNKHKDHGGMS